MSETIPATFEVLDERFAAVSGDGHLERLADGCRWAEGPVYSAAGRYLVWSDIPNDRMLRWDEATGRTGVFRHPAGFLCGHLRVEDCNGIIVLGGGRRTCVLGSRGAGRQLRCAAGCALRPHFF